MDISQPNHMDRRNPCTGTRDHGAPHLRTPSAGERPQGKERQAWM